MPMPLEFCAFLEHLAKKHISPATIRNKVSHVRQWIKNAEGCISITFHASILKWLDAMDKSTDYVSKPKEAVPVHIVKSVISSLSQDNMGWIYRAAILLISYGGFRQSEVMPQSAEKFDHKKHLTRKDLLVHPEAVQITIKNGKNKSKFDQKRVCVFKKNDTSDYCVVFAINMLYNIQPTRYEDEPLFTFPQTNVPVPIYKLRKTWEDALKSLKYDISRYSLHSIRKMNATVSYHSGISEYEIKEFGGWSSSAYRSYIKTRADLSVNAALRHHFK